MTTALITSINRLEILIDGSIAALTERTVIDDRAIADAKGRALLELSRIGQRAPVPIDEITAATVTRLAGKLRREGELLSQRLEAAALIAQLVTEAVLADDWDGTYEWRPVPAEFRP